MNGVAKVYYEIPDDLHQRAKVAASVNGQSLKDYLIESLQTAVEKTEREHYERLDQEYGDNHGTESQQ